APGAFARLSRARDEREPALSGTLVGAARGTRVLGSEQPRARQTCSAIVSSDNRRSVQTRTMRVTAYRFVYTLEVVARDRVFESMSYWRVSGGWLLLLGACGGRYDH